MTFPARALVLCSLVASLGTAHAADVFVSGPSISFSVAPTLVVIDSGLQVVEASSDEVFFFNGFYWARHGNGWYRTKSHKGGWVLAPASLVPHALVKVPPGKYKHYKAGKAGHGQVKAAGGHKGGHPGGHKSGPHGGGKGGGKGKGGKH